MSSNSLFKKTFFYLKSVIFRFVQKPSKDCATIQGEENKRWTWF